MTWLHRSTLVLVMIVVPVLLSLFCMLTEIPVTGITDQISVWFPWFVPDTRRQLRGPKCKHGYFIFAGWQQCRPILDCIRISRDLVMKEVIGKGAVKLVRRGVWLDHSVAVNTLSNPAYREDFAHGLRMLQQLPTTVSVTQLVGVCEAEDIFVTEFHPLGSADRLESIFQEERFQAFDTLSVRFGLCQQYVNILRSLHTRPDGARVMCDANDVSKTLSQFLLRDDLTLVLNDVDALPLVNKTYGQLVKCGHRELFGDFVAPEQLWPYVDREFNDSEMVGYDEKVDIWKVPDVCDAFLAHVEGSAKLRLHLLPVNLKCKNVDPSDRPSASELLEVYGELRGKLNLTL